MAPTTWFLALLLPLGGALRLGSPPAVTRRELGGLAASSLVPLLAPAAGGAAAPAAPALPSMRGKRVIITGANAGVGRATAAELYRAGADVTMAVRDAARGAEAKAAIASSASSADGSLEVLPLDLGSLKSVAAFADAWHARGDPPVDVLVLNAGVMAIPERSTTVDGLERHFAVNHLGHFALTARLWPAVRKAALAPGRGGARVVVVSSDAHKSGELRLDDLQRAAPGSYTNCATPFCSAYTQSKLANVLFAAELERRAPPGLDVTATSVHPGLVATGLMRYAIKDLDASVSSGAVADPAALAKMVDAEKYFMLTPEKGAATQLRVATDPALGRAAAGGKYFASSKEAAPAKAALDRDAAARLWSASEELAGLKFAPS